MSSDEQYAETVGKRMTEFPIERRNLLRATGAGLLGTAGAAQTTGTQETSGGDLVWEFTQSSGEVASSPTVADGTVYVGSDDDTLYAVDAGVQGSSEGSRVLLRALGHHDKNVEQPPDPDLTGTVTRQVADEAGNSLVDVRIECIPTGTDTAEKTVTTYALR